nr:Na/Pi symporter [Erysipelotrichaceae bacterium]
MSITSVLKLFGGLALFLYGMRLMGDGLKESSSGTLRKIMESVTNNPVKAFLLGLGVTALIQSSTATIVITTGLVAAGILTLHQSLGIIVGANVGTTVTGQIIRLIDLDAGGGAAGILELFKPSTLAPVALIIGIVMIMSSKSKSTKTLAGILLGFGVLFTGLMNMTDAVDVLGETGIFEGLFSRLG